LGKLGFKDLEAKVIVPDRCSGCAACAISCPYKGTLDYRDEKPILIGECKLCEICVKVCPRFDFDRREVERTFLGRERLDAEDLGVVRRAFLARSRSDRIMKCAQDGGVATILLTDALERGSIDAALVSGLEAAGPWAPVPRIASSPEELLACAGTRYSYSPNLLSLPRAVGAGLRRIAIVGTPCAISAVRKMQLLGLRKLTDPIKLLVGLMCSECFVFDCLMKEKVQDNLGLDLTSVVKINIKGKVLVQLRDGAVREIPLKDVKSCSRRSCGACDDFSSEYADISLGGVGLSGMTLALARSERGEALLLDSLAQLATENVGRDSRSLDLAVKLSVAKRARASKFGS
jgi:coenzyme F420 hydrogenase subunit beta